MKNLDILLFPFFIQLIGCDSSESCY